MVDISFGTLGQIDGKTVLTGGQSGIDTDALITALSETRRLPAVALETNITTNLSKITALNDFDSKLQALQTSLDALRRPAGFGSSTTDVFSSRLAFQTASDGSAAGNYFGVVAQNGAAISSYEVEITNLAAAESRRSIVFADTTSSIVNASGDETTGLLSAGTFQINGVDVTVSEGDNINNILANINSKSDDTGVEASTLKIAEGEFRLILSAVDTGTDNAIVITDAADSVFLGGDPSDIFVTTTPAENATITIDGDTITRQSNTFSDAIDGVTFSLFQETDDLPTAPTVTLDIGKDAAAVSEAIIAFVDAYNEVRLFEGAQRERGSDGELVETAVLNDSGLLGSISDRIVSALGAVSGVVNPFSAGSELPPTNLTDLGITLADFDGDAASELAATTNILEVNATLLTQKIESNFSDVQNIFGFGISSSSANLNLFERGNINPTEEYTLVIDESNFGSEVQLTHIDGQELANPVTDLTYIIGGVNNGYTEFGNSGEFVEIPDIDFGVNDFLVEAEAYIDDFSAENIVLGGGTGNNPVLSIIDASTIRVTAANSGNTYDFNLDDALQTGGFYEFSIERDGDDLNLVIQNGPDDNVQQATRSIVSTDSFEVGVIGGNDSPASGSFDGRIRDVKITNDGDLAGDYHLDRDFNDRSGNNNHATASGTPDQLRSTTSTVQISGSGSLEGLDVFYRGEGNETVDFSDNLEDNKKDYTLAIDSVERTAEVSHIRGFELVDSIDLTYSAGFAGTDSITSEEGSLLGELNFIYQGDGSESVDISYSQGFADSLYNYTEELNTGGDNSTQGLIQNEIEALRGSNDSIQESVDLIDIRVNNFTQTLLLRFSALEAAVAASNNILELLEAQVNATNNS